MVHGVQRSGRPRGEGRGLTPVATVDSGISKYFKPIWNARLRATAQVTKRTRSLGLIECEITDESGSLVAKVFSECMVLRGEGAKGR